MATSITRTFDIPQYQLEEFPQNDALVAKVNGKWVPTSTQEYVDQANRISRGLIGLGLKPGDKAAIISNNRPEWHIMDIGMAQAGIINVPIYPTISEDAYKYIFNDAEVKICIVSDDELLGKVQAIASGVPSMNKGIYSFEKLNGVPQWTEIMDHGESVDLAKVDEIKATIKEDDLVTLIYTSGTTGNPKGVMLSHKNIISDCIGSRPRLPVNENAVSLSFLPICHIYERMVTYLYQMTGVSIYFAESIDTIGDDLKDVKPHVFTAVPRLLEKVYDKIIAKGTDLTGIKKSLFFWAVDLGMKYQFEGRSAWYDFKLGIARKLIFSKWQEALGGRAQAVASGSAALQPRLAQIFNAAGIPVMEGYGLTESSPVISVNDAETSGARIGTVGKVLDNVEVKIAADGEILAKGPNIMMGYYNNPEATAEMLKEGWLHTGDIGEIDKDGFLKITDRKKEIFKTSGGKYIAPQPMENKFKESRFIEQVMVIGENEKHPAALIMLDQVFVSEWCKRKGIDASSVKVMACNEDLKKRVWQEVDELNADFGNYEKVKKIEICEELWTIDGGELTPTMKLKRKFILNKYSSLVERIYRS